MTLLLATVVQGWTHDPTQVNEIYGETSEK